MLADFPYSEWTHPLYSIVGESLARFFRYSELSVLMCPIVGEWPCSLTLFPHPNLSICAQQYVSTSRSLAFSTHPNMSGCLPLPSIVRACLSFAGFLFMF